MIQSVYLLNNFHSQLFDPDALTYSFRFNSGTGNSTIHAWLIHLLKTSEFRRISRDSIVNQSGFFTLEIYFFQSIILSKDTKS
jgi:hypothetical protein